MTLEQTLALIHKGQTNVAQAANNLGMSLSELQQEFNEYAKNHPIDPDAWLHEQPFDR